MRPSGELPLLEMFSVSRPFVIVAIGTLGIVAAIAGFVVREPIERAIFLHAARSVTGLDSLDAARVERDGDAYLMTDARATTPDGSFSFAARTVRVSKSGSAYRIALDRPSVRFDPAAYRDSDRSRVRDAFASQGPGAVATISIARGSLGIGPLAATALLDADAIDGTLDVRSTRAIFDGSLMLESDGRGYPIAGNAVDDDDTPVQTWSADALPLEPFAALLDASAPVRPTGGVLRGVAISDGPRFRATARLEDVKLALAEHTLHGLHGKLVAVGDGIGSSGIEGFLDNVGFRAVGEVHDLRSHYRWLGHGTNDMRSLAKLATTIAAEPALRGPIELEAIAPGLVFGQYHMLGDHGPLAISVLSADPAEKTLRFDTALASDRIVSGGERTSAMGVRTGAVGGINGDYFDIGRTYQPQGMLVRSGQLLRGPTDRAVLAIDRNRHVTFGEFRMSGSFETAHGSVRVSEFNDWPPGYVSVMTSAYGNDLKPADATFVELARLGGTKYRVVAVGPGRARATGTFGVALGRLAKIPIPSVGETVHLTYATDPPLRDAVAAIGGGPILVKDGVPYEDPHAPAPDERDYRWPVVALAQSKDGWLDLVAVDGRHPERSVGMTRPEFSELLERFGAMDAMALDSGGSVTLVARSPGDTNVSVRNVPSDNSAERWVSDALFFYSDAPRPTIVPPQAETTPLPEVRPSP